MAKGIEYYAQIKSLHQSNSEPTQIFTERI